MIFNEIVSYKIKYLFEVWVKVTSDVILSIEKDEITNLTPTYRFYLNSYLTQHIKSE